MKIKVAYQFHPVSFKPPGKWLFCLCIILFYTCTDLRDIKSRHSWIQPSEIDLTNKIGKTVTGEVRHFLPSLSQGNDEVSNPRGPNIKFAGAVKPCGSPIVFPCYVWFQVIVHVLYLDYWLRYVSVFVLFQVWKGKWNDIHIIGKKLAIKIVNKRISRDFSEEYSKLR